MNTRLFLFLLLPFLCAAEVYKSTTESGTPLYSDQKRHGADSLPLRLLPTVPAQSGQAGPAPAPAVRPAPSAPASPAPASTSISIQSPTAEQSLRSNQGEVEVVVSLPPGSLAGGRAIRLLLDQVPIEKLYQQNRMVLHNLDRGAHVLQAELIDIRGAVLVRSAPVRFYLHRHSVLFPH